VQVEADPTKSVGAVVLVAKVAVITALGVSMVVVAAPYFLALLERFG